jgi:site-specific DNA-cytosine methylase
MLDASDDDSADWELLDCFCGGGTLSFAARDSGMRVSVGVDNSADALTVFKRNFPHARMHCATLGPEDAEFVMPVSRARLHCHLSPSCESRLWTRPLPPSRFRLCPLPRAAHSNHP